MDLSQLITISRDRIDDKVEPYLVSDGDWTRYAIQAQMEAAERSLSLLYDYEITITAGQAEYATDPSVIVPVRAKLANGSTPLVKTTRRDIDRLQADWEPQTGQPRWFFEFEHSIRLYPIPEKDDVLTLRAYSYPQSTLSYPDSLDLEIEDKDHYFLVHWMCWEALSKTDTELHNPELSQRELALFEKRFGPARSANQIRHWRELPPNMRITPRMF